MPVVLPETTPDLDIWGEQINTAIETVDAAVTQAQAEIDALELIVEGDDDDPDTSGFVTTDQIGVASGVASLDGGGQVPLTQLGNLSYGDVGAAAASHQHALADLPSVTLALDTAPAFAIFNTVTSQWPLRTDITSSDTRPVIWWGDADIPTYAVPGVDLYYGPRTSGSTVPDPDPPDDPVEEPDANNITLFTPTVTVNGSLYNISAAITTEDLKTFTYLQIAVRGPNGEEQDTGFNNGRVVNNTTYTVTGNGAAGVTGTWRAFLAYNLTGAPGDWINGPEEEFTIATLGGGGGAQNNVPLIGRSGLPWNDGIFYQGGVSDANAFAAWRNRPLDAIMYFTGRSTWNEITWLRSDLTSWPGYRIVSIPSQPTNMDNSSTAAGTNNAFWVQYGLNLKNAGWDDGRTIIRLNWESNGDWNPYAYNKPNASAFVNAYKNVVNSIRVNAPNTIFDLTVNKDNRISGIAWDTAIYLPLLDHFDIVGLDWYSHGPAQTTQTSFDQAANQDPGGEKVAAFCRTYDKVMWLQEWGVSHGTTGLPGGGDDPGWIDKSWVWFNNNTDVIAGVTTYNNPGAPSVLQHSLYNPDQNPLAAARYKQTDRWGA